VGSRCSGGNQNRWDVYAQLRATPAHVAFKAFEVAFFPVPGGPGSIRWYIGAVLKGRVTQMQTAESVKSSFLIFDRAHFDFRGVCFNGLIHRN
jgi:hypothetical protein